MTKEFTFDVVVVGAGIAGSALLAALANSGLNIALVEAGKLSRDIPAVAQTVIQFDPRVSALTETSRRFLDQLGAWSAMEACGVSAYRHMTVWDADGTGAIEFDCNLVDQPQLGHIVENRVITGALWQLLLQAPVTIFNPHRVASVQHRPAAATSTGEPTYQLELEDGTRLEASLLVAADGAVSTIRQLTGMATREWSYQQAAVVATIETALSHRETAWQRFMPSGPLALLPLRGGAENNRCCSIVWSTEPAHATELMAMEDADFCQAVGSASEHCLGAVLAASRRFSFPLSQRHATSYIQPGLALVADAAHSIHPLAGQGINLGLQDVAVLAEELLRARARGIPVGDPQVLKRYQRRRMADNLAMMGLMEGFRHLFGARQLPLRWLRNVGMSQLDRSETLKAMLIRRAMGW